MREWRSEFQYLLDRKILTKDELGYLFGQIKSLIEWETKDLQNSALYAQNKQLQARILELEAELERCIVPLARYERCLKGYAKESAHKGSRENQKFWENRVKAIASLQKEIMLHVLPKKEGKS